jgi:hypothetical protein
MTRIRNEETVWIDPRLSAISAAGCLVGGIFWVFWDDDPR